MEGEIWKDIIGYEGKYKISNFGKILTFYKNIWREKSPYINKTGYVYIILEYK